MSRDRESLFSFEWIVRGLVHKNLLLVKLTSSLDKAGIFNLLWSPGIDFTESIPPAYVAWRAGTTTPLLLGFLAPIDCSKITAQ
jgi:hypothetical protein